ncbi:maltokinase N-terminal cap-like domain-containing protein [Brachybacterium nesterenkovii]|uniref:maltokinase N-terminal cap-like domain-containing protein n=1 Tax=Brachybacterium nesterenkovii TaxID=47847 RepID=UPI0032198E2F
MDEQTPTAAPFPPTVGILEDLLPHLTAWMAAQRWYAAKSTGPAETAVVGSAVIAEDDAQQVIDVVVRAGSGERATDYQVPLHVSRPATEPAASGDADPATSGHAGPDRDAAEDAPVADADAAAEIAVLAVPGGPLRVADATRTDEGRRALLALLDDERGARGTGLVIRGNGGRAEASAPEGTPAAGRIVSSRLLSGEQSNSSMIFELEGSAPVIAKLFRVLQAGENPDVVVQGALDAAGSAQVAPMHGAAEIVWGEGGRALTGHALFAQEFFPGVEDAWRVALRDAVAGTDFTDGARSLGEATASVHRDLAEHLGVTAADDAERERMVASMLARLDASRAEVPEVDAVGEALAGVLRRALDVPWPPFQRIHGDYHLGQVLAVPGRGWVLLDFEGEPMRPLADRALPDCPVRDIAGMLRSLDYVAGAVRLDSGGDATAWAKDARAAFLAGYADVAGISTDDAPFTTLLAAFEADKAAYEALYEARNRPDWLPIPLGSLERLAG